MRRYLILIFVFILTLFLLFFPKEEKEEEKEEKEVKYSYNPYFEVNSMKFSKEEADSLDAIIKNSNVKMADK